MAGKPAAERFNGFPQEAFDFFEQLALHDHRDWFQARREVYERACRQPMLQLVAEIGGRAASTKLSRINKDMRFSRDKVPYRTFIAAGVDGNYISLSAAGLYVGAGLYKPEGAALERFRRAVDDDASGPPLQGMVASLRRKGYNVDTHERVEVRAARLLRRSSSRRAAPHEGHLRGQNVSTRRRVIDPACPGAHPAGGERCETSCGVAPHPGRGTPVATGGGT